MFRNGDYEKIIKSMPLACASYKVVKDLKNRPVGFKLDGSNSAFENICGTKHELMQGKILKEPLSFIQSSGMNWLELYEVTALEGRSQNFTCYIEKQGLWVEVAIFSHQPGCLAVLMHDITEIKMSEEINKHIGFHDWLTGLYNRHYLENEMKRVDTDRQLPINIIFADINCLKLINDTYGYYYGDKLIKLAARVLRQACRHEDIVARWGGDEFVIMLPQTAREEAIEICERISGACMRYNINGLPLSLALGVSEKNKTGVNLKDVQKKAEQNMYREKIAGSGKVEKSFFRSLFAVLQQKSHESLSHIRRVHNIALKIGKCLSLSEKDLKRLFLLAIMHDIGNIKIEKNLLIKTTGLNEKEWEIIREHPETGFRIARVLNSLRPVSDCILSHHECWDGSGYPRGLKGEEIPLLARIISIADACEVMTSGRPYKRVKSPSEVAQELKRCEGNQFDPALVELILASDSKTFSHARTYCLSSR